MAAAGAPSEGKTRFYLFEQFFLRNGSQVGRIHDFFQRALLPALSKIHTGPKIFLEALVAPHMPQVAVVFGYQSMEELQEVHRKQFADGDLMKSFAAWEAGTEAAVESYATRLLEATAYSPEIVTPAKPPEQPRIFELRIYHSPTHRQLRALHERFAGPEIKIFHRVGVHPILYTSTVIGPDKPNLTYLIPFDNLAAREKAWTAFNADSEWQKVRQESIDRSGQIASVIQMSLYRATAYSPIR